MNLSIRDTFFPALVMLLIIAAACSSEPKRGSVGQQSNNGNVADVGGFEDTGAEVEQCDAPLSECGTSCVDLTADNGNCGACGTSCAAGQTCVDGACELVCDAAEVVCADQCVNTSNDFANCGGCGESCATGEVCDGMGACAPSCQAGLEVCDGLCTNTATSRENCGTCGVSCEAGQVCSDGSCELSCQTGLTDCFGSCTDTETDRANCGGCAIACEAGEACAAGLCQPNCQANLSECSGVCVDSQTDPLNCGGCGVVCAAGPNESPVCVAGECAEVCVRDFGDCDFDPTNGCELSLAGDLANCGACGNTCSAGANATATCVNGGCGEMCDANFADCDLDPATGCEANTAIDANHCGACGNVCAAGESCGNGVCQIANCPAPAVEVAGYCWIVQATRTENSAAACGRIGKVSAGDPKVVGFTWTAALMSQVTAALGCANLGKTGCCAESLWIDPATNQCETHNFNGEYWNYGSYSSTSFGVYVCTR